MKFHGTTRVTREIPWYVKSHCEFRYVKFHDTIRIKRKIPGYVSFIVKFHGTKRISRVALGSFLKYFGMGGHWVVSSRTIFVPRKKRTSENLRFRVKRNELRQLIWLIKLKPRDVKYQNPGLP